VFQGAGDGTAASTVIVRRRVPGWRDLRSGHRDPEAPGGKGLMVSFFIQTSPCTALPARVCEILVDLPAEAG